MTGRFSLACRFATRLTVQSLLAGLLVASHTFAQEGDALGELSAGEQLQAIVETGQKQFQDGDYEASATTLSAAINTLERGGAYQFMGGPLVMRAKALTKLEDYEAAIEDLKKALQYTQGNPVAEAEIQNTRAEIYIQLGAFQAALPDLQAAVKANRSNLNYQFNFGKTLVNLGGAEPGVKALTKYLEGTAEAEEVDQEKRADALRLRGQGYGALRKFEEAVADINASLEIEPENHEAFFTRSQIALAEKDYGKAIADIEEAIAKYTPAEEGDTFPFAQGYLTIASVYEERGKEAARADNDAAATQDYAACKAECEKLLEAAGEEDPRAAQVRVRTLFRKGVAERLLGEFGTAVKSFSLALELDPNLGEAYFRRGICFHFMGEEKLAIRDFEQAASINFDSPRSNLWKGMAYAKIGEYDEAIRAYGESIAVSDRYTPAYVNRGLAHLADADYTKAIDDFNEAIRLQPTEALHYYRRGKAQSLAGSREKAIRSYMNAIEFDSRLRPAYNDLASELTANGQSALAGEYRRRAAQMGL